MAAPSPVDLPATLTGKLHALFDAERTSRRLHAAIVAAGEARGESEAAELVEALVEATTEARGLPTSQGDEQALRLVRIAELLGDLHGARVVDLLIDILSSDEPEARHAAGESLEGLAFDRFKEVALGIERALTRLPARSPALTELPYLLAEIPEPGAVKLLGEFLKHADADAVAAAIEALAEVGDPMASPLLKPLFKDKRVVSMEDEGGEETRVTLGELASEAHGLLGDIDATGSDAGGGGHDPRGRR